jgi:PAS domain S-box-containing protein
MTPVDNNQVVDRRRNAQASQSPREALEQLPALVLLERIPVPTLAVLQDGTIVFANKAFAEMVGREAEEVVVLKFHDVFHSSGLPGPHRRPARTRRRARRDAAPRGQGTRGNSRATRR